MDFAEAALFVRGVTGIYTTKTVALHTDSTQLMGYLMGKGRADTTTLTGNADPEECSDSVVLPCP